MADLTTYPLEDGFETTLAQAWTGGTGKVFLNDIPSFTFPSGVTTYIVVNPGKSNQQVAEIDTVTAGDSSVTVSSISIEKAAGVNYTQQTHGVNSIVRISDNYEFWKDIATAISTKTDTDLGNVEDGFDLNTPTSGVRVRDDGGELKFTDASNPEVDLSTLASGGGADTKVAASTASTST